MNREVSPFEIDGDHLVEALLCHFFEQQELAVTCIDEDAGSAAYSSTYLVVIRPSSILMI